MAERTAASRKAANPNKRSYRKFQPHNRTRPAPAGSKLIITRPPRTDEELWEYVATIAEVEIPRVKCCEGHVAPFTAFANAYFARDPVAVWMASRGLGGKSFLLATLAWVELVTLKASVTVLGGSADQSENVLRYLGALWDKPLAPKHLLNGDPTKRSSKLTWGNTITALTASQKSIRGPHPERLRLDEVDEMDRAVFEASLGQPISRGGIRSQTVISSTRQYLGGTMDYAMSLANGKGWPIFCWCVAPNSLVSTPNGSVRLKDLHVGEEVLGWDGARITTGRVSWVGPTKTAKTVLLGFSNGRVLQCTSDHEVLTSEGWKNAGSLQIGQKIVSELPKNNALPSYDKDLRAVHLREENPRCREEKVCSVPQYAVYGQLQHNGTLPALLEKSSMGTKEDSSSLPIMWWKKGLRSQDLLCLLQRDTWKKKQRRASYGSYSFPKSSKETWYWANVSARELGSRIARYYGSALRAFASCVAVCSGFQAYALPSSGGSLRGVLAPRQTWGSRNDDSQTRGHRSGWLQSDRTLGGPDSSLVESNHRFVEVTSIQEGPSIEVWDVTVPGLESFIAEGVVVHNCYHENLEPNGWLTKVELARTKGRIPLGMWDKEYELQEPTPKNRAIDTKAVQRMFSIKPDMYPRYEEPIIQTGDALLLEFETPVRGMPYAHGIDWGQAQDFTVMKTYRPLTQEDAMSREKGKWKLARYHRFRRDTWPNAVGYLNALLETWGGAAVHDATGLGGVLDQYLVTPEDCRIDGIWLSGQVRAELFKSYIVAIESNRLSCPPIQEAENEHKFVSEADLFAGGHPPDTFIAGALAFEAMKHAARSSGRHAKAAGGKGAAVRAVTKRPVRWPRAGGGSYTPDPRGFDWEAAGRKAMWELCDAARMAAEADPYHKVKEGVSDVSGL